jgi:hypothetical protein
MLTYLFPDHASSDVLRIQIQMQDAKTRTTHHSLFFKERPV